MVCNFGVYKRRTFGPAIYLLRRHYRYFSFKWSSLLAFLLIFTGSISCPHMKLLCCSLVAYYFAFTYAYGIGNSTLSAREEMELPCLPINFRAKWGYPKTLFGVNDVGETCSRHHSVPVARISSLSPSLRYLADRLPLLRKLNPLQKPKNTLITAEWTLEKFG